MTKPYQSSYLTETNARNPLFLIGQLIVAFLVGHYAAVLVARGGAGTLLQFPVAVVGAFLGAFAYHYLWLTAVRVLLDKE